MTNGVFAWMLWRIPVGMWTQVPGLASSASSPSGSFASPWPKPKITAFSRSPLYSVPLNLLRQIVDVRIGRGHRTCSLQRRPGPIRRG